MDFYHEILHLLRNKTNSLLIYTGTKGSRGVPGIGGVDGFPGYRGAEGPRGYEGPIGQTVKIIFIELHFILGNRYASHLMCMPGDRK